MLLTRARRAGLRGAAREREELETLVVDRMEHVVKLDVPLVVDRGWGASWGEAHYEPRARARRALTPALFPARRPA